MPKISPEKAHLKKMEILDKAFEVFSAKGYTLSSMEDIVKHSGISKGGIYVHYKSKEEIFLAIAESRLQLRRDLLQETPSGQSAADRVTAYLRWFLDSLRNEAIRMGIRFTIEFWSVLSRDASKNEIAKARYGKFEKDLEDLLLEGIQKGEFRKDLDTKSAVYLILTTLDGIGFTNAVMGIKISEAAASDYVSMLMNYLRG